MISVLILAAVVGGGIWLADRYILPMAFLPREHANAPESTESAVTPIADGRLVHIPGGVFRMGDDYSLYTDVRPAHDVKVDDFYLEATEVTNRQFAQFVEATAYETDAETRGWSYTFNTALGIWEECEGASWRHPNGPHTVCEPDLPVVHVTWHDATAYATWAGRRLPTEAEWECAARGGFRDRIYPWGNEEPVGGAYHANFWQGEFPQEDTGEDGTRGLATPGAFPPNERGLVDMAGNVWEWCGDWYDASYYLEGAYDNPDGPASGEMRVQRGGSFLSSSNHEPGYRVALRSKRRPSLSFSDVGFRCASDEPPAVAGR